MAEQRRPQRPDDPLRVAVQDRQPGDRVAGRARPARPTSAGRFSLIRRITALTNPLAPAPLTIRARPTVSSTAAWAATRMPSSWWAPSRSVSRTLSSIWSSGPAGGRRDDRVVEAVHPGRAVGQLGGERRRRDRGSAWRAALSAARGWRRRRRRRPASPCRPPAGPGRWTLAVRCGRGGARPGTPAWPRRRPPRGRASVIAEPLSCVDPDAAGPVGRGHRLLAVRLDRAELDRRRWRCRRGPSRRPAHDLARCRRRAASTARGHGHQLEPLAPEGGPGARGGGAAADLPVDRERGPRPSGRARPRR